MSGVDSGLVNTEGLSEEVAAEQKQRHRDEAGPSGQHP